LALTGCTANSVYPPGDVTYYWAEPKTGWYWVPKGTEASAIIAVANNCGAKVDGAIADHGIVPSGFDYGVFEFIGPVPDAAIQCTVTSLRAEPALTVYEKKK
jgi:hypothetical protein